MGSACSGCRCRAPSASSTSACAGAGLRRCHHRCDWPVSMLGWTYTLFFVMLGSSAALFGHWLETAGPRKAGVVAALCWSGGLLLGRAGRAAAPAVAAVAGLRRHRRIRPGPGLHLARVDTDQVVSGPARHGHRAGDHGIRRRRDDRRAAGGPADEALRDADFRRRCADAGRDGAACTWWPCCSGAFGYRLPPPGWQPAGWTPPPPRRSKLKTARHVHVEKRAAAFRSSGCCGACCA